MTLRQGRARRRRRGGAGSAAFPLGWGHGGETKRDQRSRIEEAYIGAAPIGKGSIGIGPDKKGS